MPGAAGRRGTVAVATGPRGAWGPGPRDAGRGSRGAWERSSSLRDVSDEIRAAGGVVMRDGRIVVVHRPKYDDWSLPKGKLEAGESWEEAALREVEEETGLRVTLGDELTSTHYTVRGRPKTV